jgi:tRNA-binding protein
MATLLSGPALAGGMTETPFDVTIQVGEVTEAEPFPEANKPQLVKLWIDLGEESVQSAAQLGYHHDPAELVGRQVLCATDIGSVRIAGFKSEALTVGIPGNDGNPVLVTPDEEVPLGGVLY